jgi:hypothetical protein
MSEDKPNITFQTFPVWKVGDIIFLETKEFRDLLLISEADANQYDGSYGIIPLKPEKFDGEKWVIDSSIIDFESITARSLRDYKLVA